MSRLLAAFGFAFIMLVGSQNVIRPTAVFAGPYDWCGCGYCMMSITNPGSCTCAPPFRWCFEDIRALQIQASMQDWSAKVNAASEVRSSVSDKSDGRVKAFSVVNAGTCLQRKLVLRLLGNIEVDNFRPVQFD